MAVVSMIMMVMTTKDHVPQSQDTKQTQHFVFLHFVVSHVPVIRYVYIIRDRAMKIQDQVRKISSVIFPKAKKHPSEHEKATSVRNGGRRILPWGGMTR